MSELGCHVEFITLKPFEIIKGNGDMHSLWLHPSMIGASVTNSEGDIISGC